MIPPQVPIEPQSADEANEVKWHLLKMLACMLGGLCIIVAFYYFVPPQYWVIVIGTLVFTFLFIDYYRAYFRACPRCRSHKLRDVLRGAFQDPMPNYRRYRCRACGAEFVRFNWQWIPRSEWPNKDLFWPRDE